MLLLIWGGLMIGVLRRVMPMSLILSPFISCGYQGQSNFKEDRSDQLEARRVTIAQAGFSAWKDVVMLDAAVALTEGENGCAFLMPRVNDASTDWKPMQVYWGLVKPSSSSRSNYENTFFKGDHVRVGQGALRSKVAVSALTSKHRQFFSISNLKISDEKERFEGVISLKSKKATYQSSTGSKMTYAPRSGRLRIRVAGTTSLDQETERCLVTATYCLEGRNCQQPTEQWQSLSSIHVSMGLLYSVQNVSIK